MKDGSADLNAVICDFCTKSRVEVIALIIAETGTAICDECLQQAWPIMVQRLRDRVREKTI